MDVLRQSIIKSYLWCPASFKYRYIDQTPSAFRSVAALHGRVLHQLIEEMHLVNWDLDIETRYRERFEHEEFSGDESDTPVFWKNDRDASIGELVGEATEMLANYREKGWNRDANVILSEATFMLKVGRNVFSGTVDQIRQEGDRLQLLDFKSSKFPPNQQFLDLDYQLGLYALACWRGVFKMPDGTMRMLEIPPEKLDIMYYQLRDHIPYKRNGNGYTAGDERGDPRRFTSRSRKQLVTLKRDLAAIASNINRGVFPRNPGMINCPVCAFADICLSDAQGKGLTSRQVHSIESLTITGEAA
ncbi:PD-(D/E)XK nuclease family protein [bacterium]|nr:PD-(D/E)XK nuclease family protein [bacterium]